jgi:hypothetical protein
MPLRFGRTAKRAVLVWLALDVAVTVGALLWGAVR